MASNTNPRLCIEGDHQFLRIEDLNESLLEKFWFFSHFLPFSFTFSVTKHSLLKISQGMSGSISFPFEVEVIR